MFEDSTIGGVCHGCKYIDENGELISEKPKVRQNREIKFREMINLYIHALPNRVKSITFHDAVNNPAFLIMRDFSLTYSINNMHAEMARPQIVAGATSGEDVQVHTLYVDDLDIDFDYSRIYNPTSSDNVQVITFEY